MARGRGGRRKGVGRNVFNQAGVGEELKIAVNLALKNFRESEGETELQLPSSLLSTERAYVHKMASEMGLQSKSKGKGKTVMGRLGGGVQQVPPSPASAGGEYLEERSNLPIWSHRKEVVDSVRNNQVVLVTGDTGSGKTTQIPQFILEDAAEMGHMVRLVCTQPRRLTAVTVAERV